MRRDLLKPITSGIYYSSLVMIISVVVMFMELCFALYCYCNFVRKPTTYRCKASFLFPQDQWMSRTSCNMLTFGMYQYCMSFFEGFDDELMHLFTAIGSLSEIAFLSGVTCLTVFVPLVYATRSKISMVILESEIAKLKQLVDENSKELIALYDGMQKSQFELVRATSRMSTQSSKDLNQINELMRKNDELSNNLSKYSLAYKRMRQHFEFAQQESLTLRMHIRTIRANWQEAQPKFPQILWFQKQEMEQRGRSKERTDIKKKQRKQSSTSMKLRNRSVAVMQRTQ